MRAVPELRRALSVRRGQRRAPGRRDGLSPGPGLHPHVAAEDAGHLRAATSRSRSAARRCCARATTTATVVGAGVTVFEALKAYDPLRSEGIAIRVIDLYSLQPIDAETLHRGGRATGRGSITVEDHYPAGGIGDAVRTRSPPAAASRCTARGARAAAQRQARGTARSLRHLGPPHRRRGEAGPDGARTAVPSSRPRASPLAAAAGAARRAAGPAAPSGAARGRGAASAPSRRPVPAPATRPGRPDGAAHRVSILDQIWTLGRRRARRARVALARRRSASSATRRGRPTAAARLRGRSTAAASISSSWPPAASRGASPSCPATSAGRRGRRTAASSSPPRAAGQWDLSRVVASARRRHAERERLTDTAADETEPRVSRRTAAASPSSRPSRATTARSISGSARARGRRAGADAR